MKNFKTFLCLMLSFSMLLCIMPAVYADADSAYQCGAISYTDSQGQSVNALKGGEILKANIAIRLPSGTSETLMFVMLLYKNNKLIGSDCESKTVTGGAEFSAQLSIPESTEGCKVVSLLWDNAVNMRAVCAASVFPGGTNVLRDLRINGATIDGFDPHVTEYTFTVSGSETVKPVLEAEAADSASKITYIGTKDFPGKTVIQLEAADGSGTVSYTVNYTSAKRLAANATIVAPDGSNYGTFEVGNNLSVGDGGDVLDTSRTVENGRLGSKLHWDRNQPQNAEGYTNEVRGISDKYKFLLGSDYVMSTAENSKRANNGYQTKFTIYRSATIYVFAEAAQECEGWTLDRAGSSDIFMLVHNNTDNRLRAVTSKYFEVTDSSSGLNIDVPLETMFSGSSNGIYMIAIDYDGYTTISDKEQNIDPSPTSTPTPTGPTSTPTPTGPTSTPTPTEKSGADSVKIAKTEDGVETVLSGAPTAVSKNLTAYSETEPSEGSKILFDRAINGNADYPDYNKIKDVAEGYKFILGCDYIGSPAQGYNPSHRASAGYETSFKLYEGATVYAFTNTGNQDMAAANGWTYIYTQTSEPIMRLRVKMNADNDAVTNITCAIYKHFDGSTDGETVVIPKEMLYPTGGSEGSAGNALFVIYYDSQSQGQTVKKVTDITYTNTKLTDDESDDEIVTIIDTTTQKAVELSANFHGRPDPSVERPVGDELGSHLLPNRSYPQSYAAIYDSDGTTIIGYNSYANDVKSVSSDLDFLIGNDYIKSCIADHGRKPGNGYQTSFTLHESATVYVFAKGITTAQASQYGWMLETKPEGWMELQRDILVKADSKLSKHFEVTDKKEGVEVVLPCGLLNTEIYITVLDYDE